MIIQGKNWKRLELNVVLVILRLIIFCCRRIIGATSRLLFQVKSIY